MNKHSVLTAAMAAAFGFSAFPVSALAADDQELANIRNEIRLMKESYEARIQALEARLQQAAGTPTAVAAAPAAAPAASPAGQASSARNNAFNPAIGLILGGTYSRLSQDPADYRIQGFIPGGEEIGPGARSFNLGESELRFSASIDPHFSGQLTFALGADDSVGVEEAFVETTGLARGFNVRAGRFLSGVGYLNQQHAHSWDFVDAPLAYQAFFGGQYRPDGVQARWLAPTDRYVEIGVEAGNGSAFPGTDRNRNSFGARSIFAHVGDDIGASASWRAGLSYLRTDAVDRAYEDFNTIGETLTNAFSGKSQTWVADGIFKWAPNGNATQRNFKLQGEYFQRKEDGSMANDPAGSSTYAASQSGWYLQSVVQFAPGWRIGLRHDRLKSGTADIGLVNDGTLTADSFSRLAPYNPRRNALMIDYSPSEFSRLRLQFARDQARPDATDNQIFLQYIMSLGAHGAHAF